MFTTAVKYLGSKSKPAMKALEPRFRPEQNQTITWAIFEILKEHGPLNVAQTWERVQEVGVKDLTSKTQMKTVLRWMKQRQKLKQICNHVGPNKQFLCTTWSPNHQLSLTQDPLGSNHLQLRSTSTTTAVFDVIRSVT